MNQLQDYEIVEIGGTDYVPLRYVMAVPPIDMWDLALTKEQWKKNCIENSPDVGISEKHKIDLVDKYVRDSTVSLEEDAVLVRYIGFPQGCCGNFLDLIAMSKISNNGTCFVFSERRDILEFIKRRT